MSAHNGSDTVALSKAIEDGLVQRTLRLMTKSQAALAREALTLVAAGKKETLSKELALTYWQYNRYYAAVCVWWKDRRNDAGKVTMTFPATVFLDPGLDPLEKWLLADVAFLEKQDQGCYKSVLRLAIELGISIEGVKQMTQRLKRKKYLVGHRHGNQRKLEIVNKLDSQVSQKSPAEVKQVSQKPPTGESKTTRQVSQKSPPGESKTPTLNCKREISTQRASGIVTSEGSLRLQDISKTTTTTKPEPSSSSLRSMEGLPPLQTSRPELKKFEEAYQAAYEYRWQETGALNREQTQKLEELFQEGWKPLDLVTLLVCAWECQDKVSSNDYHYRTCKSTRDFGHFLNHLRRIQDDVESYQEDSYTGTPIRFNKSSAIELLATLDESLWQQRQDDEALPQLMGRLNEIFTDELAAARAKPKKSSLGQDVAWTCPECHNEQPRAYNASAVWCRQCHKITKIEPEKANK